MRHAAASSVAPICLHIGAPYVLSAHSPGPPQRRSVFLIRVLRGKAREAAEVVGAVERAHVQALRSALGSAAVARPTFNFAGVTKDQRQFLKTAVAFEDLAVGAYKAQAPRIRSKPIFAVAVSIHSVEARHAAWMRRLFGIVPAASAFDEPVSKPKATRIVVASTGFITSSGKTEREAEPRFTG